MSAIDYNVDNYTVTELLAILGLDDPTINDIDKQTNKLIQRFKTENNAKLVLFFQQIQTKLNKYMNNLKTSGEDIEYDPNTEQIDKWKPRWVSYDKLKQTYKQKNITWAKKYLQTIKNYEEDDFNDKYENYLYICYLDILLFIFNERIK